MSGLRAAARLKPVVVVKAGRHAAGTRAIKSHTGAWVGSADVFRAVTDRAGVVQVAHLEELFAAAQVFGTGRRLAGERIAIITNGGGPGRAGGGPRPGFGAVARHPLRRHPPDPGEGPAGPLVPRQSGGHHGRRPPGALPGRPGRLSGRSGRGRGAGHLRPPGLRRRSGYGGADCRGGQEEQEARARLLDGRQAGGRAAQTLLAEHHIPQFDSPEIAIEAFSFLATHLRNQKLLMQSPGPLSHEDAPDVEGARLIIEGVMAEGRKMLGIIESKAVLAAFRIPTMQAVLARTPNEALMAAEALGFPVVLKINSPDLEHKIRRGRGVPQHLGRPVGAADLYRDRGARQAPAPGCPHRGRLRGAHGRQARRAGADGRGDPGPDLRSRHQLRCRRHRGRHPGGPGTRAPAAQRLHHPDHDRQHPGGPADGGLPPDPAP